MGPKQHTLPAVYLAGFSDARRPRARESVLWVGRREVTTVFQKKAEGIAAVEDLYTLKRPIWGSKQEWSPYDLDAIWLPVEGGLSPAIEAIVGSGEYFDADIWLNVLAEFAAQVFVRGLDFGERFVDRFVGLVPEETLRLFKVGDSDHVNGARLIELHRLRGAVRHANWTILHASRGRFITNDLGRTPIWSSVNEYTGYLIPLRYDAAVELTFSKNHHQPMALHAHPEDSWVVGPVGHETLDEKHVAQRNEMLMSSAMKEIYGAPQGVVADLHSRMSSDSPPRDIVEPTLLAPFRDMGDSREFMKLVAKVATPPSLYYAAQGTAPSL